MVLKAAPAPGSRSWCPFPGVFGGGSGWSGEGVVVKGAGGEAGVSSCSIVSTGCNGEVDGTSFSGVLAGGSGWSGEGEVVKGAGGETGSTVSTGCNSEVVGKKEVQVGEAFPLSIVVEGVGEVAGKGAGRHWEMGDKSSSSSSSESLSRSSSASHRRLAAFRVRLAGGEAIVAGEETSGGVGDGWDDAVWRGAPCIDGGSVLAAAEAEARLRQRRQRRALAGAQMSGGGAHRRQEIRTS